MKHEGFPFSAVVGQDALKWALRLAAVSPAVGGVLVTGERGTAKSTAVRAFARLLPPVPVPAGCPWGCDPADPFPFCPVCGESVPTPAEWRAPRLVELPLGATEDRVMGHLDVRRTLEGGRPVFEPGLLAYAHRGVLYVDEVNLLEDHLVDLLLDAAASGVARVERDGFSLTYPSRFVLVGTMNPDEGELRPQLLDRFGLAVRVAAPRDPGTRAEVVERRLWYHRDPDAFVRAWAEADREEADRIRAARERLPGVTVPPEVVRYIAELCARAGLEGLRADIVMAEAARALAAYRGLDAARYEEVLTVAPWVLEHRGGVPVDPPDPPQPPSDPRPPAPETPDAEEAPGSDRAPPPAASADAGTQTGRTPARPDPPAPTVGTDAERVVAPDTVRAVLPDAGGRRRRPGRPGRRTAAGPAAPGGAVRRVVPYWEHPWAGRAALPVAWGASLARAAVRVAGAAAGPLRLGPDDLRAVVRQRPVTPLVVLVVDASGSMAGLGRMSRTKGWILDLARRLYPLRPAWALVAFRRGSVQVVLTPTTKSQRLHRAVATLPAGGDTPLDLALARLPRWLRRWGEGAGGRSGYRVRLVLLTDGRVRPSGDLAGRAAALRTVLTQMGADAVVVDGESGTVRLGRARRLAAWLGAAYVPLDDGTPPARRRAGRG
ncbi:MAG: ATP-binding protein [Actinomycetia bacterium]|nr:ATP-binding protein [Actinomycetes bacterium]